tara:strand:+ start:184 stop:390 length:207 start_codon:yes stop_codon:yes gene_type:complete
MLCALLKEKEEYMDDRSLEVQTNSIISEINYDLAFKLVFFDENDMEIEPPQYKALSTFSVEKDVSSQQ